MPALIQPCLVAPELRVFVIGERTLAFEVSSPSLDYREHQDAEVTPCEVPPEAAALRRLMQDLRMDFGAAEDCWHYSVHAGTEQSKIVARSLRRGETVESFARRAATVSFEVPANSGDAAVVAEPPTSSERALEMSAGAIDLDACATELRSMQTALGGQACEPMAIVVDRALPYGALVALQEKLQSELALAPVQWGLRN